jgi:hypothetical protein
MRPRAARPGAFDPAAAAYIAAVEAADGQSLEAAVRNAINAFVTGCKSDGIWTAMQSVVLLSGARTLAGAMTPLKGPAPTNQNFVSGDYSRASGLQGALSSGKFITTGRVVSDDALNSCHQAVYLSSIASGPTLHSGTTGSNNNIVLSASTYSVRNQSTTLVSGSATAASACFFGHSRSTSSAVSGRRAQADFSLSLASAGPLAALPVNLLYAPNTVSYGAHRVCFYSMGGSVNLALLEARVLTLIAAFSGLA